MNRYRVTIFIEVEAEDEESAIKESELVLGVKVSSLPTYVKELCCKEGDYSNGWRHGRECKNWVLVY